MNGEQLIEQLFRQQATVARRTGSNSKEATYAPAETIWCSISDKPMQVRTAAGEAATASATVAYSIRTELIPLGSQIRLPPGYRCSKGQVIATAHNDAGDPAFPNHNVAYLE